MPTRWRSTASNLHDGDGELTFHPLPPPSAAEVADVARLLALLSRRVRTVITLHPEETRLIRFRGRRRDGNGPKPGTFDYDIHPLLGPFASGILQRMELTSFG